MGIKMIIFLAAFLITILNVAVTIHIIRDNYRLVYEKVAETGLIWIVPVFGALVSLCITLQGPAKIREYEDIMKFFSNA